MIFTKGARGMNGWERAAAALTALCLALMAGHTAGAWASGRTLTVDPAPAVSLSAVPEPSAPARDLLDLNRATAEELISLPGIGEARARAILELREQKGGFLRVEELLEVPGIGEKLLETLTDYITVGG